MKDAEDRSMNKISLALKECKYCFNSSFVFYISFFLFSILLFYLRRSFALVTQAGVQWRDFGSPQPLPPGFRQFFLSLLTGTRHHAQLIFCILSRDGFHHVDQDGLDLLTL